MPALTYRRTRTILRTTPSGGVVAQEIEGSSRVTIESNADERHVVIRVISAAAERYRPPLGWMALVIGLVLALLPAVAIREAEWIDLSRVRVNLEWVVFFSLVSGWWLVSRLRGWATRIRRRPEKQQTESSGPSTLRRHSRIPGLVFWTVCGVGFLAWVSLGVLTISQVLVHWIPGPVDLWRTIRANDLLALTEGVEAELDSLVWRYTDWAEGVQGGGAYQDDFVFLSSFWRSTVVAGRSHGAARSFDPKRVNRGHACTLGVGIVSLLWPSEPRSHSDWICRNNIVACAARSAAAGNGLGQTQI